MPNNSFFPSADAAALAWAQHFSSMITASATTYGLTAAQATAYATLVTNYQTALAASEPTVRSKTTTAAKNQAKATLKLSSTQLANIIYGQPWMIVKTGRGRTYYLREQMGQRAENYTVS